MTQYFCRNRGAEWKKKGILVDTGKKWVWKDDEQDEAQPEPSLSKLIGNLRSAMRAFPPEHWEEMVMVVGQVLSKGKPDEEEEEEMEE